jgi:hypothetical protein
VGGEALGGCRPGGHPGDGLDSAPEIYEAAVTLLCSSSMMHLLRTTPVDEGNQAVVDEGDPVPGLLSSSSSDT